MYLDASPMQAEFLECRPLQAFLALSASEREEMKQGEEEYQKRAETNQHLDPSEKSSGVVQPMRKLWARLRVARSRTLAWFLQIRQLLDRVLAAPDDQ